jgi:hypothetical protein
MAKLTYVTKCQITDFHMHKEKGINLLLYNIIAYPTVIIWSFKQKKRFSDHK